MTTKHRRNDELHKACQQAHDLCYYLNAGHAGVKGQWEKMLRRMDAIETTFDRVRQDVLAERARRESR